MTAELRNLEGTVVAVTGAGSGIGAATVRRLLDAGARVVANDLAASSLEPLAHAGGDALVAVAGDVGDPATSEALLRAGLDRWGRMDSVVLNAGVGFFGDLAAMSDQHIEAMVRTNVLGTVWLARAAVARFTADQAGGDVVVVASVAGLGAGGGNEAVYAATKAAQVQFATSLDREVRPRGIRVSVVAPAAVNTYFAVSTGRFGDVEPAEGPFLRPEDVAFAITTVLRQPRRMRTGLWTMWSQAEQTA